MTEPRGITINTDASYYSEHKIGGYAFWIKCDLFKITKGGYFKVPIEGSTQAETYCIGNAIAQLLAQKELPKADFLVINTDNKVIDLADAMWKIYKKYSFYDDMRARAKEYVKNEWNWDKPAKKIVEELSK